MLVEDEIALLVGVLPIAPGTQPQGRPAHAREVRHVLVDHGLAIAGYQPCHAVIGSGHDAVIGAVQRDFGARIAPTHHSRLVDIGWANRRLVGMLHDHAGRSAVRRAAQRRCQ